jgi:hypothetical protein
MQQRRPVWIAILETDMPLPPELQEADNRRKVQDYPAALMRVDQYVAAHAKNAGSESVLGLVYRDLGDLDRSEAHLRSALDQAPNNRLHLWNLAITLLQKGQWPSGWTFFESRGDFINWRYRRNDVDFAGRNQALAGQRVLIYQEQGAGDFFQFARFIPIVKAGGATITIQCDDNVAPVIAPLCEAWEIEELIAGPVVQDAAAAFDFQIPVMSLPHVLGDIAPPNHTPYLSVPDAATEAFQDVRDAERPIVIAWKTNSDTDNSAARSCPLAIFADVLHGAGVEAFSVQFEATDEERAFMADLGIMDLTPRLHSFADTAAAIVAAGRVLTVDSAVGHLAGALAARTCVLLHSAADWRWHDDQDTSRWYPSTRLTRQTGPGDWASAVPRARDILAAL